MSKPNRCRVIARLAHKGQQYGSKGPYFDTHIEDVVERCSANKHCTSGVLMAALLHDVIEDTELTAEDLHVLGVPYVVVKDVEMLTKRDGEDYATYIQRILDEGSMSAIMVKYYDLQSNMDQCRKDMLWADSKLMRERAERLLRRYAAASDKIRAADHYDLLTFE